MTFNSTLATVRKIFLPSHHFSPMFDHQQPCCNKTISHLYLSLIIAALIIGTAIYIGTNNISNAIKPAIPENNIATVQENGNAQQGPSQPAVDNPAGPTIADMSGVTIDDSVVKGNKNAPVTIVNFSDFQCPFCKRWFEDVEPQLLKEYVDTGKARLVFKNYAFLGADSITAAEGIWCANEQGKYWNYYNYLFANQGQENDGWANKDNLKKLATKMGLNATKFATCLNSGKYKDKVTQELEEAKKIGIKGTPQTFINGEAVPGAQAYSVFREVVERKLGEID